MLLSLICTSRGDQIEPLRSVWGQFAGETHHTPNGEILSTVIYVGF